VADGVHLSSKGMRRFVNAIGAGLSLTGAPLPETQKRRAPSSVVPGSEPVEAAEAEALAAACADADSGALRPACTSPPEAVAAPPVSPALEKE
jgi:hypothetical protein